MTDQPTELELLTKAYKDAKNDRANAWAAGNKAAVDIAEERMAEIQFKLRMKTKP